MVLGEWIGIGIAAGYVILGVPLSVRRKRREERARHMAWIEEIKREHPFPGERDTP